MPSYGAKGFLLGFGFSKRASVTQYCLCCIFNRKQVYSVAKKCAYFIRHRSTLFAIEAFSSILNNSKTPWFVQNACAGLFVQAYSPCHGIVFVTTGHLCKANHVCSYSNTGKCIERFVLKICKGSQVVVARDMPKKSKETSFVLKRVPIVIIPRKRKYKNYVSRRRNTHLLASLRKCASDPHIYRSFNQWEGLWREFSISDKVASPSVFDEPQLAGRESIIPASSPTSNMVVTSLPQKSPFSKHLSEKVPELNKNEVNRTSFHIPFLPGKMFPKDETRPCNVLQESSSKIITAGVVTRKKHYIAPVSKGETGDSKNVLLWQGDCCKKVSSSTLCGGHESSGTQEMRFALQKSAAPSPASFPKTLESLQQCTTPGNALGRDANLVTGEVSEEQKNFLSTSAPKALRKAYGSKSGTTICAIGSPLNIPSTSNINVEDQRVIEKKLSNRKRKDLIKEGVVFPVLSKCQMDVGEKSSQADEQKAKKTVNAVAAAFSTQSVSVEVSESMKIEEKKEDDKTMQQRPSKATGLATANLLAQLQLPPTVSAKVDKIIASGQKSRLQNFNDQRARMKAHLDRQAAGVLPDDDDGHLIFKKNDVLHGRWELREELGEGTFGRVVKAYDKQKEKMRAVKIVRNVHKYRDAAYLEIKVLTKLKQLDPNGVQITLLVLLKIYSFRHINTVFFQRKYYDLVALLRKIGRWMKMV
ncbi:hypothetical protein DICVIV_09797 [Dictyocaulus viviparus]|uniref:Protein kinase domain-containing protein n=1 Tax=Dictyocaulus viviparus TaxID=29172 RepID=A0A0D8XJZ5_DICVI|nr:hypothetical protein DICVIV_09797 [Dictyocaulus viviparus]